MKYNHSEAQIAEFIEVMNNTRKVFFAQFGRHHNRMHGIGRMHTPLQMRGLMNIKDNPGITVGELADRLSMSSASVAQYISRLERVGLIEKTPDPEDKRINRLKITGRGEKITNKLKDRFSDKFGTILSAVSDEDLNDLIRILKKITKNIETDQNDQNC